MDDIARKSFLYDFYGEMLNEHQRQIYEDFVFNDMSLGEIAADEGISRQGVADMIKRCDTKLEGYEKKLHLVERFLKIKADIEEIHRLAEELQEDNRKESLEEIEMISNQILEEL